MKTFLLLLMAIVPGAVYGQDSLIARVRIEDQFWQNDDEWKTVVYGELLIYNSEEPDLSELVPPPHGSFLYSYTFLNGTTWFPVGGGWGYGLDSAQFDGFAGDLMPTKVRITGIYNGQSFDVTSFNSTPIGMEGDPKEVNARARREDEGEIIIAGNFERWTSYRWWDENGGTQFFLGVGDSPTLRWVNNTLETRKFHHWENPSSILRWQGFPIFSHTSEITGRYVSNANGITINAAFLGGSSINGVTLEFKDPWYLDYVDANKGNAIRNRGTSAVFTAVTSPFNPNSNASGAGAEYKGVFLNQAYDPQNPNSPYYSIRAPQSLISSRLSLEFDSLSATGATVTSPKNRESAVIFHSSADTVTARYRVVGPLAPEDFYAGGSVGQNVHLSWTEHPSSDVTQYQIWRKVKPLGENEGPAELIGTVNRGTTSFTDEEFDVTSTYSDCLLTYGIKAYYQPGQIYSGMEWTAVFGEPGYIDPSRRKGPLPGLTVQPKEFSLAVYPNPFNPSTVISFELPAGGEVALEIFDITGRKVAALLQGERSAGYHQVTWNGRDSEGRQAASGAYLYRFSVAPHDGKQPFHQSGKLVLTK